MRNFLEWVLCLDSEMPETGPFLGTVYFRLCENKIYYQTLFTQNKFIDLSCLTEELHHILADAIQSNRLSSLDYDNKRYLLNILATRNHIQVDESYTQVHESNLGFFKYPLRVCPPRIFYPTQFNDEQDEEFKAIGGYLIDEIFQDFFYSEKDREPNSISMQILNRIVREIQKNTWSITNIENLKPKKSYIITNFKYLQRFTSRSRPYIDELTQDEKHFFMNKNSWRLIDSEEVPVTIDTAQAFKNIYYNQTNFLNIISSSLITNHLLNKKLSFDEIRTKYEQYEIICSDKLLNSPEVEQLVENRPDLFNKICSLSIQNPFHSIYWEKDYHFLNQHNKQSLIIALLDGKITLDMFSKCSLLILVMLSKNQIITPQSSQALQREKWAIIHNTKYRSINLLVFENGNDDYSLSNLLDEKLDVKYVEFIFDQSYFLWRYKISLNDLILFETDEITEFNNELNELKKNRSVPDCDTDNSNDSNPITEKYTEIINRLADKKLNMGSYSYSR